MPKDPKHPKIWELPAGEVYFLDDPKPLGDIKNIPLAGCAGSCNGNGRHCSGEAYAELGQRDVHSVYPGWLDLPWGPQDDHPAAGSA
jgi:hypothetical protein